MHIERKKKFISAIIITFVAAIAAIVGFLCIGLPSRINDVVRGVRTESRSDAETASPRRQYTALSVDFEPGMVAYVGITKAGDIKNNIVVKGTYMAGGSGEKTVVLDSSEFVVNVNDEPYNQDDVIFAADETIPGNFNLSVSCGSLSAPVGTIDVKNPYKDYGEDAEAAANNKIPQYDSLTVDLPEGASNIVAAHTAESLKKFLVVKGVSGEDSEVIHNKELYNITVNGSIASGGNITVTADYKYSYNNDGDIIDTSDVTGSSKSISVVSGTINDVVIAVTNGINYVKEIWTKSDSFHAFVSGMNNDTVASALDVFYVYDQNASKKVVTGGSISGANYNNFKVVNDGFDGASGAVVVNVELFNGSIGDGKSASITLNFETQRIIKITANHKASTNLESSTPFDNGDFTVIPTFNNGEEAAPLQYTEFAVLPNTYVPTAEILAKLQETGTNKYDKTLTVILNDDSDVKCDVTVKDIVFTPPVSVSSIGGTPAYQTVLTPFDYSNIKVTFDYGDDVDPIDVELSEFADSDTSVNKYISIEYFDNDRNPISAAIIDGKNLIPSVDVRRIKVIFQYYDTNGNKVGSAVSRTFSGVMVNPAEVDIPNLSVVAMDYSDNCFKQIRGVDFEKVSINNVAVGSLDVEISVDGDANKILAKYGTDTTEENLSTDFAAYDKSGKITFKRGGKFTVKLRINNENFGWKSTGVSNPSRVGSELIYEITINKAEINIRLDGDNNDDTIKLIYGGLKDSDGKTTFGGWENRIHYSIMGSSAIIDNDVNKPEFQLLYYGFTDKETSKQYTYTRRQNADGNYDLSSFSAICPKDVTTTGYKVAVHTKGNAAYKESLMLLDNAVTLIVNPKEIKAGNAIDNTKIYDRAEHEIKEFVNTSNAKTFLEYDDGKTMDTASPIITVVGDSSQAETSGKYKHAGTYKATLVVNSKNYVWENSNTVDTNGNSTVETTFTINKATFAITAAVKHNSFVYGDTTGAVPYISSYTVNGTNKTVSGEFSQPDDLYPVVGAVEYYVADSSDPTQPSATKITETDCSKWPVGKYVAKYAIAYATVYETSDYELPAATAPFEITPRSIDVVNIVSPTDTEYNGSDILFELKNYNDSIMTFGTLESDGTTFTPGKVVGTTTDGNITENVDLDNTDGKFSLPVKHAAKYSVTVSFGDNAKNYVWKENGTNAPIALNFEVKQFELTVTDDSGSTVGADGYVKDSYAFRYKGDAVAHGKPAFTNNAVAADGLIIIYTVTDKDGASVAESDMLTIGVGEYNMALDFTVSGTGSLKSDYKLPNVLPDKFYVLAAELMFPSLKASAVGETPVVTVEDGKLVATYVGAEYDVENYLQSNTTGLTTLAGLDISVDKTVLVADTYTITVKPASNYSWASGQTFNGNSTSDDDQLEITFGFTVNKKSVTIAWNEESLTAVYDGTPKKPTANVTDGEIYSRDTVTVIVSVGDNASDAENSGGEDGQSKTDAGEYTAVAYKLVGSGSENYTIDKTNSETNYSKPFVINKQRIAIPESSKSFTFGDNRDGLQIGRGTTDTDKSWAWLFTNDVTYPKATASISAENSAGTVQSDKFGANFESTTGKFTYENAGKYTITLTIGDTDNYCWNVDTQTDYTQATADIVIEVAKKSLAAPTDADETEYSDTAKTVDLGVHADWKGLAATGTFDPAVTTSYVGTDHFGSAVTGSTIIDLATNKFTYTDAGIYTVTLTIRKTNNFYFGEDTDATTATVTVTVNRMRLESPTIAEPYNIVWTGGAICPELVNEPDEAVTNYYNKTYGTVNLTGDEGLHFGSYGAESDNFTSTDRGEYFIKFTLKKDVEGFNYKNYEWLSPYGDGSEAAGRYVSRKAFIINNASETTVYLHYAITNALLNVKFAFAEYTFGDNATDKATFANNIEICNNNDYSNEKTLFIDEMKQGKVEITATFKLDNAAVYTLVWKRNGTETGNADDPWSHGTFTLSDSNGMSENNLPWNAGTYTVSFALTYVNNSDYQNNSNESAQLTVKPFEITVDWSDSSNVTYDGSDHKLTATINKDNVPKRGDSASTEAEGLTLSVEAFKGGNPVDEVKTVGTYLFKIDGIAAPDGVTCLPSNFSFIEANKSPASLVIEKRAVTIRAAADTGVYGNALNTTNGWTVTVGNIVAEDETNLRKGITFKLVDGEGKYIDVNARGYYNVDTYYIELTVPTGGVFDNYTITVDTATSVAYTVTKRDITVTIDNTKTNKIYGVAYAENYISVTGNAVNDTVADIYSVTVKKGEEDISQFSSIGDYVIAVTATDNYNITSISGVVNYTVTAAELTVSVDLQKYTGEKVPDSFKTDAQYLFEQGDGRNVGIYTISGFLNGEVDKNAFYAQTADSNAITGQLSYEIGDDNVITLKLNGLAWGNYVFAAAAGTLAVDDLTITVTVKEQSVTYYDNDNIPDLMEQGTGFTVAYPASSFGKSSIEFDSAPVFGDIFNLTTVAIVNGKTNIVGEYDIVAEDKIADGYIVTFVGAGDNDTYSKYYAITPATLTDVAQLDNYTNAFTQSDITPNVANGVTFATTVDHADKGTVARVEYKISDSEPSEWADASSAMPSFYNAGTYRVYYRVSADNHNSVVKHFTVTINQATQNSFTSEFNYQDSVFASIAAINRSAWIYGGYNESGAFVEPLTNFFVKSNGDNAPILVTVYFSKDGSTWGGAVKTQVELAHDRPIKELLAEWNVGEFGAGYYKFVFEMEEDDNFAAPADSVRYFRIEKAELTVTPTGEYTTTYGDAFDKLSEVTYNVTGFVLGENKDTTNIKVALDKIVWTTDYKIGDHAGEYTIEIDNSAADKYVTDNYTLKFGDIALTVGKRVVTIKIDDKENYFNLYYFGKPDAANKQEMSSSPVSGTYYDNDVPFDLYTDAFNAVEGSCTNNVGRYAIYAKFNTHTHDGVSFANDYDIHFSGCSFAGSLSEYPDAITQNGEVCAGTFEIKQSLLAGTLIAQSKPYDGKAIVTSYNLGDNGNIGVVADQFKPVYYKNNGNDVFEELSGAPVNVGKYKVEYKYSGNAENYIVVTPVGPFDITAVTVNIYVGENADSSTLDIQYGEKVPTATTPNGRFDGYKYRLDGLKTSIEDEIANGNVFDLSGIAFETNYTSLTAVGTSGIYIKIIVDDCKATNYIFKAPSNGSFNITPRTIDITVNGADSLSAADRKLATGVYDTSESQQTKLDRNVAANLGKFFTDLDSDWKGANASFTLYDLALSLALKNTDGSATDMILDVGDYKMIPSCANGNYAVNFCYPDGAEYAKYSVEQAQIYVKVIGHDTTTGSTNIENFAAIYGNTVVVDHKIDGLQGGQTYSTELARGKAGGSVVNDLDSVYTPWVSEVGDYMVTYSAKPDDGLWFKNYKIEYVPYTFAVDPRTISVDAILDKTYSEAADGVFNKGENGLAQHALVKFTDETSNIFSAADPDNADEKFKLPTRGSGYTIAYVYDKNASEKYNNGNAPDKAGQYTATLTLTTQNYVFASSAKSVSKTYNIKKKLISFAWSGGPSIPDYSNATDEEKVKEIAAFNPEFMKVDGFRRFGSEGDTVANDVLDYVVASSYEQAPQTYTYDSDGLRFKVYSTGYYNVEISIKTAAAERNYELNTADGTSVTLNLVVTTDGIIFTSLSIKGWTYGEYKASENQPKVTVDGGDATRVSFTFASLAGRKWEDLYADQDKYFPTAGFEYTEIVVNDFGLNNGNFNIVMPENAGIYVLRAYYPATGQSSYCLMKVDPKSIAVPTIVTDASNNTYTGRQLSLDIKLDRSIIIVDTHCLVLPITGGVRLSETNVAVDAQGHTVNFVLASDNYIWDDGAAGDTRTAYWLINKGKENITVGDLDTVYSGRADYSASASTKFGGTASFAYAKKADGVTKENAQYDPVKPIAAGEYWIRATISDSDNYIGDTKYATLVIDRAILTAMPTGRVVYGNIFDPAGKNVTIGNLAEARYSVELDGFVEPLDRRPTIDTKNVRYMLVDTTIDPTRALDVRSYALTLALNGQYVDGMSADNYYIVAADGVFEVVARAIDVSVKADSVRTSVYGETVSLGNELLTVSGYDVAVEDLGIELGLVGVEDYDMLAATSYSIYMVDYVNRNFEISFTGDSYTVTRRKIKIGEYDIGGGFVHNVKPMAVKTLLDNDSNAVIDHSNIRIVYTYTNLNGTLVNGGAMPESVGRYYVYVTHINNNYELVGPAQFLFTVSGLIIDGSTIKADPAKYTGSTIVPVIDFGEYKKDAFIVSYADDRTNVGMHKVILTLADTVDTKWNDRDTAEYVIDFEIVRGDNSLNSLDIAGWVFGEYDRVKNAPAASTRFGGKSEHIFNYYVKNGNDYELLTGVPVNAGTYYVTVTVPLAPNYNAFTSDYVEFTIARAKHNVPTLGIITDGDGKNDTYTGEALAAIVNGFDPAEMSIHYDGISNINGNVVTVYATNADTYTIRLSLKNNGNYTWADNATLDGEGYALLTWTVNKKRVAVPTDNTSSFVVNGQTLVYIPNGFDANIMNITGNTTSYGGTFRVTVTLKDPSNYEWATQDGEIRNAYDFTWNVVGADTVFAIVMGVVGGLVGAAAAAVLVQFLVHRKRIGGSKAAHAAASAENAASSNVDNGNTSEGE